MRPSRQAVGEMVLDSRQVRAPGSEGEPRVRRALARCLGDDAALIEDARRRLVQLAALHEESAGQPCHFIRTPGRINLIGEHTDYNGLPVLPMTLQRDVLIAYSPRHDHRVVLRNVSAHYPPREFALADPIPPSPAGDWCNYVKAAAQALLEDAARGQWGGRRLGGADLTVGGNLPGGAGLSSSSALVVAAALALLFANQLDYDRPALAERLAQAEHYVGTRGGGMDQAITLLGQPGHVLLIDFFPLRTRPVALPPDVRVVAAHSLVRAEKTGARRLDYNLRPLECAMAVALLNRALTPPITRLGQLEARMSTDEAVRRVESCIPEPLYSPAALRTVLGPAAEPLLVQARALLADAGLPEDASGFAPRPRALHVLREGRRVRDAVAAFGQRHHGVAGHLLDASDKSCHQLYQIGTPELAALSDLCRRHGALGARLTGAGFGGFVVSLVPADRVETFLSAIAEDYYQGYLRRQRPELYERMPPLPDALFTAVSTRGGDRLTLGPDA